MPIDFNLLKTEGTGQIPQHDLTLNLNTQGWVKRGLDWVKVITYLGHSLSPFTVMIWVPILPPPSRPTTRARKTQSQANSLRKSRDLPWFNKFDQDLISVTTEPQQGLIWEGRMLLALMALTKHLIMKPSLVALRYIMILTKSVQV